MTTKTQVRTIQPLPIWQMLLFLGGPGVLAYLGVYVGVPIAQTYDVPLILSWTLFSQGPIYLLATGLVIWYFRQPGTTWATFKDRFRFHRLTRREWMIYVPVGFVVVMLLNELLAWTVPIMAETALFQRPPVVPLIFEDPYVALESGGAITFLGVETAGQWWLIPFWVVVWMFGAVLCEEIVWRGYLLPRMELRFGGTGAWILNGLMWNFLYHLYTPYNFISDLPTMLILPFLAWHARKTTLSAVLHSLIVGLALVILIPGIF